MNDFETILNQCLDDMARGTPLETCLRRYPQYAEELRPLLETAMAVRAQRPSLSPQARQRGLSAVREAVRRQHEHPRSLAARILDLESLRRSSPVWAAVAAAILVAIVLWNPGETLTPISFPVRQWVNTAAARWASDPLARANRHYQNSQMYLQQAMDQWQERRTIPINVLEAMVTESDAALQELASVATERPEDVRRELGQLLALTTRAGSWVNRIAPELAGEDGERAERVQDALTIQTAWIRVGLEDASALADYTTEAEPTVAAPAAPQPTLAPPPEAPPPTPETPTHPSGQNEASPTATPTATPTPDLDDTRPLRVPPTEATSPGVNTGIGGAEAGEEMEAPSETEELHHATPESPGQPPTQPSDDAVSDDQAPPSPGSEEDAHDDDNGGDDDQNADQGPGADEEDDHGGNGGDEEDDGDQQDDDDSGDDEHEEDGHSGEDDEKKEKGKDKDIRSVMSLS